MKREQKMHESTGHKCLVVFLYNKRGGKTCQDLHYLNVFLRFNVVFFPYSGTTSSCCLQYKLSHNVKHQTTYEGEAILHRCLFQLAVNQFWLRNQRHRWSFVTAGKTKNQARIRFCVRCSFEGRDQKRLRHHHPNGFSFEK